MYINSQMEHVVLLIINIVHVWSFPPCSLLLFIIKEQPDQVLSREKRETMDSNRRQDRLDSAWLPVTLRELTTTGLGWAQARQTDTGAVQCCTLEKFLIWKTKALGDLRGLKKDLICLCRRSSQLKRYLNGFSFQTMVQCALESGVIRQSVSNTRGHDDERAPAQLTTHTGSHWSQSGVSGRVWWPQR